MRSRWWWWVVVVVVVGGGGGWWWWWCWWWVVVMGGGGGCGRGGGGNNDPMIVRRLKSVRRYIGLKTLLQQGISVPIFYGDLVYKFKRIVGKPNFSDQFKKIVKRYIRVGYNLEKCDSLHA